MARSRLRRRLAFCGTALCGGLLWAAGPAAAQTLAEASGGAGAAKPSAALEVQEVVVTAERHNSTVQETPISLTALSGAQLAARGITTVENVVQQAPGLSVRSAGPGQTEYEARGLASTGGAAPTVGFYLNDVPMSPPAAAQVGKVVIDPDLYDVDHLEVLRGPQGTLYGAGSMGGTIRVVTALPKLGVYDASVETTVSGTDGGGVNGGVSGMVNLPLGDVAALRLVGTDKARSGWIDRVVLSSFPADGLTRGAVLTSPVASVAKDVNTENLNGLRASLLYKPNDQFSLTGQVLYQKLWMGGYDEFDDPPGSRYLAHYEAYPIAEPISDEVTVYSVVATENLGFATLTSDTAYWARHEVQTQDASENLAYTFGFSSIIPIPYTEEDTTRQFSEEIRLSSPEKTSRLRWVVGAYYTNLYSLWQEQSSNPSPVLTSLSPPGTNPHGVLFDAFNPYHVYQMAAFADGSFNITDTLKLAAGIRWDHYSSKLTNDEWGLGAPPFYSTQPGIMTRTAATAFTPRFNLSYSPSHDLNIYATAAKGFRPGGLNQYVPAYCGAAAVSYQPDSVWNYEIGEKARMFDGRLTVNADFYYINWSHIQQLLLLTCGDEYYDNSGNGRSFGPELETTFKITSELSISIDGAYTNAEITKPNAILANNVINNAAPGTNKTCPSIADCTLPILNVPKYTGNISLVYTRPLSGDYTLNARIIESYVGEVVDESFYPIVNLPPYNVVNLRIGISAPKWTAAVFVDNLTNTRAEISANNTSFQFNIPAYVRMSTNQPLTAGVDLSYHF